MIRIRKSSNLNQQEKLYETYSCDLSHKIFDSSHVIRIRQIGDSNQSSRRNQQNS